MSGRGLAAEKNWSLGLRGSPQKASTQGSPSGEKKATPVKTKSSASPVRSGKKQGKFKKLTPEEQELTRKKMNEKQFTSAYSDAFGRDAEAITRKTKRKEEEDDDPLSSTYRKGFVQHERPAVDVPVHRRKDEAISTSSLLMDCTKGPEVPDAQKIKELFRRFDCHNNNGLLSLAEIDLAVGQIMPELGKDKRAMMRALKAADTNQSGWIEEEEFERFLKLLAHYHELSRMFAALDRNKDRRMSFAEFKSGYHTLGFEYLDEKHLKKEFDKVDTNHGGFILFDEFCAYFAKKKQAKNQKRARQRVSEEVYLLEDDSGSERRKRHAAVVEEREHCADKRSRLPEVVECGSTQTPLVESDQVASAKEIEELNDMVSFLEAELGSQK